MVRTDSRAAAADGSIPTVDTRSDEPTAGTSNAFAAKPVVGPSSTASRARSAVSSTGSIVQMSTCRAGDRSDSLTISRSRTDSPRGPTPTIATGRRRPPPDRRWFGGHSCVRHTPRPCRHSACRAPDVGDEKAAGRQGGYPTEAYPQVLVRDVVVDLAGEYRHGSLHQLDGHPLSGTAVARVMITAALRDEVVGAAVPAA